MKPEDYKNIRDMKGHNGYRAFREYLDFEADRAGLFLESADGNAIYRLQGQIAALREIIRTLDNIDEYIGLFKPENL